MAEFGEFIIVYDILPELAVALEEEISKLVRKAAFDIEGMAKVGPPRDTGFLKNSIYVVTNDSSTYGKGATTPPKGAEMLEQVEQPHSPTEAVVAVGANYGVFVEYGTSRAPAQPYLTPAAELVRVEFLTALSRLEEHLAAAGGGGAGAGEGE